jgi:hypothetical protein
MLVTFLYLYENLLDFLGLQDIRYQLIQLPLLLDLCRQQFYFGERLLHCLSPVALLQLVRGNLVFEALVELRVELASGDQVPADLD